MLILNQRRTWIDLPGQEGVQLLLSPLPASRRAVLTEQCVILPTKGGNKKKAEFFDQAKYCQLVAAECLHGWKGVVGIDEAGQQASVPFTPGARAQLMEIDPVAAFVVSAVTGLSIHMSQAEEDAGNDSARAPAG